MKIRGTGSWSGCTEVGVWPLHNAVNSGEKQRIWIFVVLWLKDKEILSDGFCFIDDL